MSEGRRREAYNILYQATREKTPKPSRLYHPDRPYFLMDTYSGETWYFAEEADRDVFARDVIASFLDTDNLWNPEVESIHAGVITHQAREVATIQRPPEDEIDEDGYDSEGNEWLDECDRICNYRLLPVKEEGNEHEG